MTKTLLAATTFLATACMAQQPPPLRIVSPQNGASVQAGGSVQVDVQANVPMEFVSIGGRGGMSGALTSSPYSFSAEFSESECGQTKVVAFGKPVVGALVYSSPLVLNISCDIAQTALEVMPSQLSFQHVGQQIPLAIMLKRQSGGRIEVGTGALIIQSSNPQVAQADASGVVTATGPGTATLTVGASAIAGTKTVQVAVPASQRGDLDADGDVDSDDLAFIQRRLNKPTRTVADACDLNQDGRVDALDSRILATLCTRPRCANQ